MDVELVMVDGAVPVEIATVDRDDVIDAASRAAMTFPTLRTLRRRMAVCATIADRKIANWKSSTR